MYEKECKKLGRAKANYCHQSTRRRALGLPLQRTGLLILGVDALPNPTDKNLARWYFDFCLVKIWAKKQVEPCHISYWQNCELIYLCCISLSSLCFFCYNNSKKLIQYLDTQQNLSKLSHHLWGFYFPVGSRRGLALFFCGWKFILTGRSLWNIFVIFYYFIPSFFHSFMSFLFM